MTEKNMKNAVRSFNGISNNNALGFVYLCRRSIGSATSTYLKLSQILANVQK